MLLNHQIQDSNEHQAFIMEITARIWNRPETQIAFPGIVQAGNTCVFASIASGLNWLTGSEITEQYLTNAFHSAESGLPTFGSVLRHALPAVSGVQATEFHDLESPLPKVDDLFGKLMNGAILLISVEIALLNGDRAQRAGSWHTLCVFHGTGELLQVWDTNGKTGFLKRLEFNELLTGSRLQIPYPPVGVLVPHDRHHCVLLCKEKISSSSVE